LRIGLFLCLRPDYNNEIMIYKRLALLVIWTWLYVCSFVTAAPQNIIELGAKDALINGGVRKFSNPARLGLKEVKGRATWIVNNFAGGLYDLDIIYSAGNAEKGKLLGAIEVTVGDDYHKRLDIFATGGWGATEIIPISGIEIKGGDFKISVTSVSLQPGVGTVMDLWSIILERSNEKFEEAGKLLIKKSEHGQYVQYIPRSIEKPVKILVLIHGSIGAREAAVDCARVFLGSFISEARQRGLILLAPVFDKENFQGPGGGYRGLFGRLIGADGFVNEILTEYQNQFRDFNGRIYLYGHSAGGQFVSRYIVRHHAKVIAAVISAAGTYAFPDPKIPWADGMMPFHRQMLWPGDKEPRDVSIVPDPNGWLAASMIPVTVLVGEKDATKIALSDFQKGSSPITRAICWVEDMNALAAAACKQGRARIKIVEGAGHWSAPMVPIGMKCLFGELPIVTVEHYR